MSSLQRRLLVVLLSSAFAAAVPCPDSLQADIILLLDNDLQGKMASIRPREDAQIPLANA